jgi:hypothetical protein
METEAFESVAVHPQMGGCGTTWNTFDTRGVCHANNFRCMRIGTTTRMQIRIRLVKSRPWPRMRKVESNSMKQMLLALALVSLSGGSAYADDAPVSATSTSEQGEARQLGVFLGGTASQYDLCVKKGFLPRGSQSAEETAKSILDKTRISSKGVDLSPYVQDGWNMMKKEIADNESFFTQEKCASVGKEWAKVLAATRNR